MEGLEDRPNLDGKGLPAGLEFVQALPDSVALQSANIIARSATAGTAGTIGPKGFRRMRKPRRHCESTVRRELNGPLREYFLALIWGLI